MRNDNRIIIEQKYKPYYEEFVITQVLDLNYNERHEILRIYRDEINPAQPDNSWCGNCVVDMLKQIVNLYNATIKEYDSQNFTNKIKSKKSQSNKG
jgi:hypothetical protein